MQLGEEAWLFISSCGWPHIEINFLEGDASLKWTLAIEACKALVLQKEEPTFRSNTTLPG